MSDSVAVEQAARAPQLRNTKRLIVVMIAIFTNKGVNELLAGLIGTLNAFLAILIIGGTTAANYLATEAGIQAGTIAPGSMLTAVVVGAVAGTFLAIILCGIIALFVSINGHLQNLDKKSGESRRHTRQAVLPPPLPASNPAAFLASKNI